eukprot:COSAG05_NODE_3680_length_1912_cov_1.478213_2_plen_88_part_00
MARRSARLTRAQREVQLAKQAERNMADARDYVKRKRQQAVRAEDIKHTVSSRRTARWGNPDYVPEPVDVMDAPTSARPMLSESSFPS